MKMNPHDIGHRYDMLAATWDQGMAHCDYGLPYLRRAIAVSTSCGVALDVGCGSGGRLIEPLLRVGFSVTGVDVSAGMLAIASRRHPTVEFVHADICGWTPPHAFDLIIAWDSLFHVPYAAQHAVIEKLCLALAPGGVFLFTAGGRDGEIMGEMHGQTLYYSSLSDEAYLHLVHATDCQCLFMERDQYPDDHLVMMAVRPSVPEGTDLSSLS